MKERVDKTGSKKHALDNSVAHQKIAKTNFQFTDNRPEIVAQKKIQKSANENSTLAAAIQLQTIANHYSSKEQHVIQKRETKTGLPNQLKSGIEQLSGFSMNDVKVHYNSSQPAQLNAYAYAQGTNIHLGPGQEKHLPHEAWHVVQQKQGRVKPTLQMKGSVAINDEISLEKEADVMGQKALKNTTQLSRVTHSTTALPIVQRMVAIAIDHKNHEDDMVIMTNTSYALSYAGGPVKDFGTDNDFSGMKKGEDLMIVEHGSPGKIKNYNATQVANILLGNGNAQKAIPKNIAGITLLACNAGTDPAAAAAATPSLVAGIASVLHENGWHIVVDGKRGLALTSPAIGERTVDPAKNDEYRPIQYDMVKKHGFNADADGRKIKGANQILTEKGIDHTKLSIEEKAHHIAGITGDFYKELIKESDKKGVLHQPGKGERYSLGDSSHLY